jgi:thiamine biosynthesis lipoprotein
MLSMVHPFYAMASDCAAPLRRNGCKDGATCCRRPERSEENRAALFALPGDSELTRINKVAAAGGSIDIDPETAGFIAYAKACFAKSDGAFDITSGLLRKVWGFSAARVPDQASIDAVLPFIGSSAVAARQYLHRRPQEVRKKR